MRKATVGAIVCAWLVLPFVVRAASFTVDSSDDGIDSVPGDGVCRGPDGKCTLRGAIIESNALAGADTISLPAERFILGFPGGNEDLGYKGDLDITDELTINGTDENETVIDGNRLDRVFDVHGQVHVSLAQLTIENGQPPDGGDRAGIDPQTPPQAPVRNLGDGGGLFNEGSLNLDRVMLRRNRAGRGQAWGGGLVNVGTAVLTHVTFKQNSAGDGFGPPGEGFYGGGAGGMWNIGSATLSAVEFVGNRAGDGSPRDTDGGPAGGMLNTGDVVLTDVVFRGNRAGDSTSSYYGATGGDAGGMENDRTATLARVTFYRNRAGQGPAVANGADDGGFGGGMVAHGTTTMTDVRFISNRAGRGGRGADDEGCGGYGGGLYNDGEMEITNGVFDHNQVGGGSGCPGGDGGGIYDEGSSRLTNITITRNRAGRGVGFYENNGGSGGGILSYDAVLTNCTVALNRAGAGTSAELHGEGEQVYGEVQLLDTIIFGRGKSCPQGGIASLGHNIDGGRSCDLHAAGDLSNVNPLVAKPKNNGGFSETMALRVGSPAIDAGDNANCPTTDQRGVSRPQGPTCDIGAYEFAP